MRRLILSLAFLASFSILSSSGHNLDFPVKIHDFGQVLMSDGPVSCTFKAVNRGTTSVQVQSVTTSCGCTDVKWDRNPVAPGGTFKITATYSNDEGPFPFDKTLTVKVVGDDSPIVLHLRGISGKKVLPDSEVYTCVYGGTVGFTSDNFKCGNLVQDSSKGEQTTLANLSSKAVKLTFSGVSDGLELVVKPNPIPAKSHATLYYTVSARKDKWGYNDYAATPVINGTPAGKTISIRAFTAENFSMLTKEEKGKGSRPIFRESTFSFGKVARGTKLTAKFTCSNKGAAPFVVHKIDVDYPLAVPGTFPRIEAGGNGTFTVSLDTKNLPVGEALVMLTLTTNSPLRPIVNLFLAGVIK